MIVDAAERAPSAVREGVKRIGREMDRRRACRDGGKPTTSVIARRPLTDAKLAWHSEDAAT